MKNVSLAVRVSLALGRFELRVEFTTLTRVTGVFGPSGAGKTSLLQVIAGLRPGASGRISMGEEIWLDSAAGIHVAPERRGIGYVPQEGLLFPHQSVRRNLLAGAGRARRAGQPAEVTLRAVCALLELEPVLERDVATLSGGERQRVALGRALCSGPRLMLLDEPLASLDLPLRRRVLPFLRRVREEFQIPMILVSHDPSEVQALCDEVVVLRKGALVAGGPARQVLTDPRVFSLSDEAGFENVLPCTVKTSGPVSEVLVGASSVSLLIPAVHGCPGDTLLVGIPARDIIIAGRRPVDLSAQNILPARISTVEKTGDFHLVMASLGQDLPELAVEVTERACRQLQLASGREVFLIVKTASCTLFE